MQNTILRAIAVLAAAFATSQCGGGSSDYGAPMSPTSPTPSGTTASVTVSIVATNGNKSYQPNPVQTSGLPLVFRNNDTLTHRIVMDDGSTDFGTIAPGASSAAKAVGAGTFHCTIHPSMVGSINGAEAPQPAPGSGDGY